MSILERPLDRHRLIPGSHENMEGRVFSHLASVIAQNDAEEVRYQVVTRYAVCTAILSVAFHISLREEGGEGWTAP